MKLEIETPTHLVDVNGLALDRIEATPEGGCVSVPSSAIGSCADNGPPRYALLSRAPARRGMGQLRNRATTAATCFNAPAVRISTIPTSRATKRQPGSGCRRWPASAAKLAVVGRRRCVHRQPSERHGGRHGALDAAWRPCERRHTTASIPIADLIACRGTGRISNMSSSGRIDHRGRPAEAGCGKQIYRKVSRPGLPSICARLRRRRRAAGRNGHVALGGIAPKPWRDEAADKEMANGAKAVAPTSCRARPMNRTPSSSRSWNAR